MVRTTKDKISAQKCLIIIASITVGLLISANNAMTAQAISYLPLQKIATQPEAAVGFSASNGNYWDSSIHSIAFEGNTLIPIYGDWNFNSDSWGGANARTSILPLDLSTNQWLTSKQLMTGTESNNIFRTINGHLYTPTTDPSIYGSGGYATNASGQWVSHFPAGLQSAVHVFDMASLNDSDQDLWVFGARDGSGGEGVAVTWRSTDGGANWSEVATDANDPSFTSRGFERMKWGAVLNGKMYMQADSVQPAAPMRVFDGTTNTWSTLPHQDNCTTPFSLPKALVFDGKIICGRLSETMYLFDGTNVTSVSNADSANVSDLFIYGDYLYTLSDNGQIARTSSWTEPFQAIGRVIIPDGALATAIGIYNDRLYIGDREANIWTTPQALTTLLLQAPSPSADSINNSLVYLDGTTVNLSVTGSNFASGITAAIDGVTMSTTISSSTSLTVAINSNKLSVVPGTAGVTASTYNGHTYYTKDASLKLTNPDGGTFTYELPITICLVASSTSQPNTSATNSTTTTMQSNSAPKNSTIMANRPVIKTLKLPIAQALPTNVQSPGQTSTPSISSSTPTTDNNDTTNSQATQAVANSTNPILKIAGTASFAGGGLLLLFGLFRIIRRRG